MTPVIFDADSYNCRVAALTSTRFLVAYTENDDNDHLAARVGTLAGGIVSFGAVYELDAHWVGQSRPISLVALDSSRAVVTYTQSQNTPDTLEAYVLTVSGNDITKGAHNVWFTGASNYLCSTALDSATILVAYQDGTNASQGTARVATIVGTDITFGAAYVFNSEATYDVNVCQMTSTTAIVVFRTVTGGDGKACVLTVTGTAVSPGAASTFQTGTYTVAYPNVVKLDGSRFAVAYKDNKGYVKVGDISGGGITFGASNLFLNDTHLELARLAWIGTDRLSLAYGVGGADSYYVECVVSETSVTFGTATEWYGGDSPLADHAWTAALDGQNVIIVYRDSADNAGKADLLSYPEMTTTTTAPTTTAPPTTTTTAPPTTTTTAPPTTTTTAPPTTTTTAPPTTTTTAPPTTTTTAPPTTTTPMITTTVPSTTTAPLHHPADTGPGAPDWRCSMIEVVAYAAEWLGGATLEFQGTPLTGPGVARAYILRAAAIALAHYQTRYEDTGSAEPIDSTLHPHRWQEAPDI